MKISDRRKVGIGVALLVAISIAGYGSAALAGPGHGERGHMGGPILLSPMLLKSANLSSDQEAKLKQIRSQYRDTFKTLFTQLKTASDSLNAKLLAQGPVAPADLTPLVNNVEQVRQQMAQQRINEALDVRNVLTADQIAKIASVSQQLQALHSQMRSIIQGDSNTSDSAS
jgi:Spy/CpxP family protein refolding chaperone